MSEKEMPLWLIDAFTEEPFFGNPAGVCFTEKFPTAAFMQKIARELHWSETAFLEPYHGHSILKDSDKNSDAEFNIRWFSPEDEAPICGHATLASAHFLWDSHIVQDQASIIFHSSVGMFKVEKTMQRGLSRITFDFPMISVKGRPEPDEMERVRHCLFSGGEKETSSFPAFPAFVEFAECYHDQTVFIAVLPSEDMVRTCRPDLRAIAMLPYRAVIITAQADSLSSFPYQADFVLRYFAPKVGIPEDPVCGSAHCRLVPLWAEKLGKEDLTSHQLSRRGGWIFCQYDLSENKVKISGSACTVMKGFLPKMS